MGDKLIFKSQRVTTLLFTLLLSLVLAGCSSMGSQDSAPNVKLNLADIHNAVPKVLPRSKTGNPPSYTVFGKTYYVKKSAQGFDERGIASWYGTKFHGRLTSSGTPYNMFAMTAAMRTLPLPTFVQVTNLNNDRKIIVEVNDRGPFKDNRIIDLSYAAAAKLGMLQKGTALVDVRAINPLAWDKKQSMIKEPHLKQPGHPQLYLQVAAFEDKANAEQLLRRVHMAVIQPSRIDIGNDHGKEIYRVQIGPLANVDISDLVVKRLKQAGFGVPMTIIT